MKTGENPELAKVYEAIQLIVSGPLFSTERLKAIWQLNTGHFEEQIDAYARTITGLIELTYAEVNTPVAQGTVWDADGTHLIMSDGLSIKLAEPTRDSLIEISVDNNDDYKVAFMRDSTPVASIVCRRQPIPRGGLRVDTLRIADLEETGGYTSIHVIPLGGDDAYSVGHLRLLDATQAIVSDH